VDVNTKEHCITVPIVLAFKVVEQFCSVEDTEGELAEALSETLVENGSESTEETVQWLLKAALAVGVENEIESVQVSLGLSTFVRQEAGSAYVNPDGIVPMPLTRPGAEPEFLIETGSVLDAPTATTPKSIEAGMKLRLARVPTTFKDMEEFPADD